MFKRLLGSLFSDKGLTYEDARDLANHEDPQVRARLAARTDLKPEILYFLAEDPSPEVRRAIANNTATPSQADLLLAKDEDVSVRSDLAAKIVTLAPELTQDEHVKVRKLAHEVLEILARDQVTRVRQIISETLKDVADAPADVIKRLAMDTEIVVSGPVLEWSPVLTDEDLLDIIKRGPITGALSAISRRAGLSEPIADAVCHTTDEEAIASLLGNASAQIREETLDYLAERAVDIESWHGPLARRPNLSSRAALRMARYVAENLLGVLAEKENLDPATVEAVKTEVRRRLDEPNRKRPKRDELDPPCSVIKDGESALERAQRHMKAGKLSEACVTHAVEARDVAFVLAALSVLGEVPLAVIEKIFATRSAKGVVAASWKAGLSMQTAFAIQKSVAHINPREILCPADDGRYPLAREDMTWQIDFFSDLAGA